MKTTLRTSLRTSPKGVKFIDTNDEFDNSKLCKEETNDCVVRALAASCGVTYEEAHAFAKDVLGRKDREGTMGCQEKLGRLINNDALICGKKWDMIGEGLSFNVKTPRTFRYAKGGKRECAYTVGSWAKKFAYGTFFIIVRNHALAIIDGVVYGNTNDAFAIKTRVMGAFRVQ